MSSVMSHAETYHRLVWNSEFCIAGHFERNRTIAPCFRQSNRSTSTASRQVQFGLELIWCGIPFPARELIDSHSEKVRPKFGIVVLLRPEVERDGREFVDQGVGKSVLG